MRKYHKSIYERIIPFNLHPLLFWPAIGLFGFLLGEFIIQYFGENRILWTRIFFTIIFSFIPPVLIYGANQIPKVIQPLTHILWGSQEESDDWIASTTSSLVSFKSIYFQIILVLAIISSIITLRKIGLPFENLLVNIFALVLFFTLIIFNAHAAYFIIKSIHISIELAEKPVSPPFYIDTKFPVIRIQNHYSLSTLAITIGYICFTLGVLFSPYGVTNELQIWLAVGAFFPTLYLIISFFQIHKIMQNIKNTNLMIINDDLQILYQKAKKWPKFNLIDLIKVMEIQDKISRMKEWPFEFQGIISFLISLIVAIVQVLSAMDFI